MASIPLLLWLLSLWSFCHAYTVPVFVGQDTQICSGMWSNEQTHINVTFDKASSQGQVAMVIYEWRDSQYLGKVTSMIDDTLPKTYVCTSDAVKGGFCTNDDLGRFIIDLPDGTSMNSTTFWSARVSLSPIDIGNQRGSESGSLWANPDGMPQTPDDPLITAWKRQAFVNNPSPSGIYQYHEPIQYEVRRTGYYCVAIVPVTVLSSSKERQASTDIPFHPTYEGTIEFFNTFKGELPASEYPKVNFYFAMFIIYAILGGVWAWMCYKHRDELLPIQYYLSGLVGFLIVEMIANWVYYRYLNAHGRGTASTVFLFVVAILDAGRNALSFFMLLVVSLGLSVVRESLGRTMIKCQLLTVAHFIFGVLYAVGIVELELESTSALILLLFVIPLAMTLSGFLLWIMYSLNATITQLTARKQTYKLSMFTRLHRILLASVFVIAAFFIVSSFSFSDRLAEDFAARTWQKRWWLLDGWLALLYLVAFASIAYLWRPTPNNRRLAMSEELAQDEADAEDYDLEALESRVDLDRSSPTHRARDDDEATLVGSTRRGPAVADDVVFEIGDEDADDEEEAEAAAAKKRRGERRQGTNGEGQGEEREGLIGSDKDD